MEQKGRLEEQKGRLEEQKGRLEEQVKVVAKVRLQALEAKIKVNESRISWEASNAEILDTQNFCQMLQSEQEEILRKLTLEAYALDKSNKTPAEGVAVKEITKLDYDQAQALFWGYQHEMCLQLDKKTFESSVKANPHIFEFVTITQEPQATIATKLEVD